jgi:F-type H+-transporting ATPase subunit delta
MTSLDAKRSGRALFEATQPHGTARATLDSLDQFVAILREHANLRDALMSPFVDPHKKMAAITQVADLLGTAPAARSMLLILAQMRQPAGLLGIIKELRVLVHRAERRVDAEVTTAVPLTDAQVDRLREALSHATDQLVTVKTKVDPAIIGGAVTRVGTLVFDGSLTRQLARIKEQFVQQG